MSTQDNYLPFVESKDGQNSLIISVVNMHCASCIQKIESGLNKVEGVSARCNLTKKKVNINWSGAKEKAAELAEIVSNLGFEVKPFNQKTANSDEEKELKFLLRCIAIAAFAAGNLMIITDALWSSTRAEMGSNTRDLLNWVAAAISLPTIIYSGLPFYKSAWSALKKFKSNMDVPISLAIILGGIVSVIETLRKGEHVYFDSSVMLIFFLLVGRYLDKKARSKAKSSAQDLLANLSGTASVINGGSVEVIPISEVKIGMILQVAVGDKIPVDAVVIEGESEIDESLITGETLPKTIAQNSRVFAGCINLTSPIKIKVVSEAQNTVLSEIAKLIEKSEQSGSKYVKIADKVAEYYTPAVNILAASSFIFWVLYGTPWLDALLISTTVLIITCPCAMGLAVPIVQVIASSRLFKKNLLIKTSDALEKLAKADTVIFDKTGTLTTGHLALEQGYEPSKLKLAASLAAKSSHPLACSIFAAYRGEIFDIAVQEEKGKGLSAVYEGKNIKLGKRSWCGDANSPDEGKPELWLNIEGESTYKFSFSDTIRSDAKEVIAEFKKLGFAIYLLSGDRKSVVTSVAKELGIDSFEAEISPLDKNAFIEKLNSQNRKTLMIGDGLNDAAALKNALVSISPSTAVDISQNVSDIVFMGAKLSPIIEAIKTAKRANKLVKQNFVLAIGYNILAVPLAVAGFVTPLIAAIAMSSSSIIVVANSLRLKQK